MPSSPRGPGCQWHSESEVRLVVEREKSVLMKEMSSVDMFVSRVRFSEMIRGHALNTSESRAVNISGHSVVCGSVVSRDLRDGSFATASIVTSRQSDSSKCTSLVSFVRASLVMFVPMRYRLVNDVMQSKSLSAKSVWG